MAQMRSLRRSVAFAAIVGGICAFAGFAAAGHATTSAKEIRVVTGFQFITVVGTVEPVAVGTQGQRELKCPAQYPVLVTGGFRAGGTFSKSVMSFTSAYALASEPGEWRVKAVNPHGAGGPVEISAEITCMKVEYGVAQAP